MIPDNTFTCVVCQQPFSKTGQSHKFCRPCATSQGAAYSAKYRRKKNSGHFGHRLKTHQCERCHHAIVSKAHNRRYCDECHIPARKARVKLMRSQPAGFINHRISSGIRQSLRMAKQGHRWESLVGFSLSELMAHLEDQFLPGMTWANRYEWHIDHRRPLCSFEFQTPDCPQFREAWALTNLQPLWAVDNLIKGGRWTPPAA